MEASEFLELSQMEVAERVNHVNARRVGAQKLAIVPNARTITFDTVRCENAQWPGSIGSAHLRNIPLITTPGMRTRSLAPGQGDEAGMQLQASEAALRGVRRFS